MLADIAQSAVILINFREELPTTASDAQIRRIDESADLMRRIGRNVNVPLFSLSTGQRRQRPLRRLGQEICCDLFTIFSDKKMRQAVMPLGYRHLFFGGLWLDENVLMAALAAQSEGFDSRVFADLSMARDEFYGSSTIFRLNQHGILLTTARQAALEWALTTQDATLRTRLTALLTDPSDS
jgi:hypothetical protein